MNVKHASANISDCGEYRYELMRSWSDKPRLAFLMLNPSTADAAVDDATIRRCVGFAQREKAGGIVVVNLYALRATNPKELWTHGDPIGPGNDKAITRAVAKCRRVICAWGGHGPVPRVRHVVQLLDKAGAELLCLGTTQAGAPRHPLYLPRAARLQPWTLN